MSDFSIKLSKPANVKATLKNFEAKVKEKDGGLRGDENNGYFEAKVKVIAKKSSIEGNYDVREDCVMVTITKRPSAASKSDVEKKILKYWEQCRVD